MDRKQYMREWYQKNREKERANRRAHYQENKDVYKERAREWEKENPEATKELKNNWRRSDKGKAQARSWYAVNSETHNARTKDWKERNPGKVREYVRTRQATKLHATPSWANRDAIQTVYEDCERIQSETGIPHHVDHIVPLQGDTVCGLHVEGNLQILTEEANLKKGNKHFIPLK